MSDPCSERWVATFTNIVHISDLRKAVRGTDGQSPCVNGSRSICWKAFLLFEHLDTSTWTKILSDSRSAYGALRDHFLKDIEHPDGISANDPLTGDDKVRDTFHVLEQFMQRKPSDLRLRVESLLGAYSGRMKSFGPKFSRMSNAVCPRIYIFASHRLKPCFWTYCSFIAN